MLLETLTFMLALTTLWLLVFVLLPWVGRAGSLYGLHALRDRVFEAALEFPDAMQTQLYRDIDFILTHAIYVVRERPILEALQYFGKSRAPREQDAVTERADGYRREVDSVFVGSKGVETLMEIFGCYARVRTILCLRIFTGHPAFFLLGFVAMLVGIAGAIKDMFVRVYDRVFAMPDLNDVSLFVALLSEPSANIDPFGGAIGIIKRQAARV